MSTYMENIRQDYAKSGWRYVKEVRELLGEKACAAYIWYTVPHSLLPIVSITKHYEKED